MKRYVKLICVILIVSMVLAVPVCATDEMMPWSSSFFATYDPYIYYESGSYFEVWFDVVAVRKMDELGVSAVEIQVSSDGSNWETATTCYPENYPQMICENTGFHMDCVSYTGTIGYYYRAYVTFYAKNSTGIGKLNAYSQTIRLVAAP